MAADWKLSAQFMATDDQEAALKDADFVIITISTGGFGTMAHDLKIPEKFGIYQTVGDTVGPGGWSRALRNISVFVDLTRKIRRASVPSAAALHASSLFHHRAHHNGLLL